MTIIEAKVSSRELRERTWARGERTYGSESTIESEVPHRKIFRSDEIGRTHTDVGDDSVSFSRRWTILVDRPIQTRSGNTGEPSQYLGSSLRGSAWEEWNVRRVPENEIARFSTDFDEFATSIVEPLHLSLIEGVPIDLLKKGS